MESHDNTKNDFKVVQRSSDSHEPYKIAQKVHCQTRRSWQTERIYIQFVSTMVRHVLNVHSEMLGVI